MSAPTFDSDSSPYLTFEKLIINVVNKINENSTLNPGTMKSLIDQPKKELQTVPHEGLSADELNYFKNLILDKRLEALNELVMLQGNLKDMLRADDDDASTMTHHMADTASDQQDIAMTYRLIERTRKFIDQLDKALHRIENGNYGYCRATGKPIEKGRLEFAPHTRYSMEAKRNGLDKKGVGYA